MKDQTVRTNRAVNTDSNCHTTFRDKILIAIVRSIFIEIRNGRKPYLLQNTSPLPQAIKTAV